MNDDQKNYWQPDEGQTPDEPVETAPQTPTEPAAAPAPEVQEMAPEAPAVAAEPTAPVVEDKPVTWSAEEYLTIDKGGGWYVIFALVVIALIAFDVFLLHSWTFSALVVVMAVALVLYARRPPRTLTYTLSMKQGLHVGEKLYHFDEFKSFGLIQDGEHHSIMLIPRKRFAPGVSVYFPEEAGERIVDILGQRLPMKELKLDIIDIVVRKLRL